MPLKIKLALHSKLLFIHYLQSGKKKAQYYLLSTRQMTHGQ